MRTMTHFEIERDESDLGQDFGELVVVAAKLKARNDQLRAALVKIRDVAYSPIGDDHIWMDERTPIGQFIDITLAE